MNRKVFREYVTGSKFVVTDVKPDGNCQFRAISNAVGVSHRILRKAVAKYILSIPIEEFRHIISIYREEKKYKEFVGQWNPDTIKNRKELSFEISKNGFNFQGDYITLSILSKILRMDFIIIKTFSIPTNNYLEKIETPGNQRFIILDLNVFGNSGHYKTVGYKLDRKPPKLTFSKKVFSKIFIFLGGIIN